MNLKEIHIRDPYILLSNGKYYLYGSRGSEAWGIGTGLDVFTSDDLEIWSKPVECFKKPEGFWADRHFWAPEVHECKGKFYMFVSFKSETECRGTQILISDLPEGPFKVHSDGPVTPREWECLDGTFYLNKNGVPYIIFCHEWVQVKDGEMCSMQLSDDLKFAVTKPEIMFKASEPTWMSKDADTYVTDGPFMYRTKNDQLLMIWSTFHNNSYCEAIAYSDNGEIDGKWLHKEKPLFSEDGGHGMIFMDKYSNLKFIIHQPNSHPLERPVIMSLKEIGGTLSSENEYQN